MLTAGNDLPGNGSRKKAESLGWQELAHNIIVTNSDALARRIMDLHMERNPELDEQYSERSRTYYIEDTGYTLEALASSILLLTPGTFGDYVTWLLRLLVARKIPTGGLPLHFDCLRDALHEFLPAELAHEVDAYINAGVKMLPGPTDT